MLFLEVYLWFIYRNIIFYSWNRGSLNLSSSTLAAQLLLVLLSMPRRQPRVQGQTRHFAFGQCQLSVCAGGLNEVLGWCSCSGDNCSSLPAGTSKGPHWYLAMAEMLWESCSQGHNIRQSKDMRHHRKPLAQCVFEFIEYLEHLSSAAERLFVNEKTTYLHWWSLENSMLGIICC